MSAWFSSDVDALQAAQMSLRQVSASGLNRYAVVRCAISGAAWATPRAYVICHC